MKKNTLLLLLSVLAAFVIVSCAKPEPKIPENVKEVQHKIDKALESEPTYSDLVEIRTLYDDLLKAEQEMVTNYDQIKELMKIDSNVVSCVYAVKYLRKNLKNPSSLQLYSAQCCSHEGKDVVKFKYSATNSYGGAITDDYYFVLTTPKEKNGQWSCKMDETFAAFILGDMIDYGSVSSQDIGKTDWTMYKGNAVNVDISQISDNIGMTIIDE